jgi:hypothetical protein
MVTARLNDGEGADRGMHNFLVQTRSPLQDHSLMILVPKLDTIIWTMALKSCCTTIAADGIEDCRKACQGCKDQGMGKTDAKYLLGPVEVMLNDEEGGSCPADLKDAMMDVDVLRDIEQLDYW